MCCRNQSQWRITLYSFLGSCALRIRNSASSRDCAHLRKPPWLHVIRRDSLLKAFCAQLASNDGRQDRLVPFTLPVSRIRSTRRHTVDLFRNRAMAQAVSRRPLAAESRFRSRASPSKTCSARRVSLRVRPFFLVSFHQRSKHNLSYITDAIRLTSATDITVKEQALIMFLECENQNTAAQITSDIVRTHFTRSIAL